MILKLNIGILVAVAFVATATAVYGSETALEIMDNHTKYSGPFLQDSFLT